MAEVAGLALAILPVLIHTAENFRRVHRFYRRFRKCGTEVEDFRSRLKIQHTIFRNECQNFLAQVVGDDEASEMLSDPLHPMWEDRSLEDLLYEYMGASVDAYIANIEMIQDRLKSLEKDGKNLGLDAASSDQSPGDKAWRNALRKKLKFTLAESSLESHLSNVQNLIATFIQLINSHARCHVRRPDTMKPTSKEQRKDVGKFRLVQRTSAHLYETLATACTRHDEHTANISLKPISLEQNSTQISFDVSFSPIDPLGGMAAITSSDPIWFTIKSSIKGPSSCVIDEPAAAMLGPCQSRKRQNSSSSSSTSLVQKRKKAVRFTTADDPTIPITFPPIQVMPILRPNFCVRVKKCPSHLTSTGRCLGPLDETSDIQHLVYIASKASAHKIGSICSLETVLNGSSRSLRDMPPYDKLRFCKLLAVGVLQFYATPWLANSWTSRNILVFDSRGSSPMTDDSPWQLDLSSVYTKVPIHGTKEMTSQGPAPTSYAMPPNKILFGLGAMMLEIAFESQICSMRNSTDLDQCSDTRYTDLITAQRLSSSESASTKLGPSFSNMVKKCIFCDFGKGQDLSKPELQASFYREIVCELSRLETKFRELHLDS